MRLFIGVTVLALLGCGSSHETIDVAKLSDILDRALPRSYSVSLKMVEVEHDGKDFIRCILENASGESWTVDESTLPWETPGFFDVNAVTPGGDVVLRSPIISVITNPPRLVTIDAGESLEGEFEVQYLPFIDLPRSQDLLLLWTYGLGTPKSYLLSGTMILKER